MAAAIPLKCITIPATSTQTATVIFIHGLGNMDRGFEDSMMHKDETLAHVKWILPQAPFRPVTASENRERPAWFDISSYDPITKNEDTDGLLYSLKLINQVVAKEVASGIPANRILVGGFSQGGVMSLLVGLTGEHKVGGLAILSGWLPLKERFKDMVREDATLIPMFWAYGSNDFEVQKQVTESSLEFLGEEVGIPLKSGDQGLACKVYEGMAHATNPQEMEDFKAFIKECLPNLET